jgi:hypothetical protein
MARSRCDPFDVAAIRAAIGRGETSERAAYLAYAASAGRPYARSTFRSWYGDRPPPTKWGPSPPNPAPALDAGIDTDRWLDRSPVKPRILSLSAGGGLRVKAGSLIAFDSDATLTYSRAAKPPLAIVLSTVGGFVSMEAVRFAARAGIAIVALDRSQGFITVIGGKPKANARLLRCRLAPIRFRLRARSSRRKSRRSVNPAPSRIASNT